MKRSKKKAKVLKEENESDQVVYSDEWKSPPAHLKGRNRGLWYQERGKWLKKNQGGVANPEKKPSSEDYCAALINLFGLHLSKMSMVYFDSVSIVGDSHERYAYYDIEIDDVMIQYLSGFIKDISEVPPPSLVAQMNVLRSIKDRFGSFSGPSINTFFSQCGNPKMGVGETSREDNLLLASIDQYRHLEDTPFKTKFLSNISGSIENNLDSAAIVNAGPGRNAELDKQLYNAYSNREVKALVNPQLRNKIEFRKKLPTYSMKDEIIRMINENRVVLISGETGCGKTTQVGQFILDDAIANKRGSECSVICTQPRRISAISVANRVAEERNETVGKHSVGYQIRLEKKVPQRLQGTIIYCTTGVLIQHMQQDASLSKYSHIIMDEIHERDTLCDFALTILKDIIGKRKNLKIILMSATLNAAKFSKYFNNCPMMTIPGYTFPVDEYYLEDVLRMTRFRFSPAIHPPKRDASFNKVVVPYVANLRQCDAYSTSVCDNLSMPESEMLNSDLIVELLKFIANEIKQEGAVLIFVPGWDDINHLNKKILENFSSAKYLVIPLHSRMPTVNQQSVFNRPPRGVRKIIIATNIAETSITIDDVVFVINTGKAKIKNYDADRDLSTLQPEWISKANALQRKGRAGRVRAGTCFHLYSKGREQSFSAYPLPEILRTRLEEVILSIKILQLGTATNFLRKVMDPPDPRTVESALNLLQRLKALDKNEILTPLGYHLAKLPLDPRIGKMLLMATIMSCLNPILSMAVCLSFKDPFFVPLGEEKRANEIKLTFDTDEETGKQHQSDHLIMMNAIAIFEELESQKRWEVSKRFCYDHFMNRNICRELLELKTQFMEHLHELGFVGNKDYKCDWLNANSKNIAIIKAVICSGLYPNVAIFKRQVHKGKGRRIPLLYTPEDGKVMLHPRSVNSHSNCDISSPFFTYYTKMRSSDIFLHDSTATLALPLLFFCDNFYMKDTSNGKKAFLEINKDIIFRCKPEVAQLIKELRLRFDWIVEYTLSHPGQTDWNLEDSVHLRTLTKIVELFTYEEDMNDLDIGDSGSNSDGSQRDDE